MPPRCSGSRCRRRSPSRWPSSTPLARSFWAESKRVSNRRIKAELGVALAYPDYRAGLAAVLAAGG